MPQPFHRLTVEEFAELLEQFPFRRNIDAVHMHHTWRPNHAQYRGLDSIVSMWRFHTHENGWSDIAQHVSIGPEGAIWTGRDWNRPPASAVGFNGNDTVGPFMFETIGDFDRGCDPFDGPQRATVVEVIARVQLRFGLPAEALRFHNQMTNAKTCPGSGMKLEELLAAVKERRAALEAEVRRGRGAAQWAADGAARRPNVARVLLTLAGAARGQDAGTAEPLETDMTSAQARAIAGTDGRVRSARAAGARGGQDLTPEMLSALRPHVVNLNQGQFSTGGLFRTLPGDVDAIFNDHLEQAFRVAQANNRALRILFWAHGGLVSERSGLWIAHQQIEWWKRNNVYPIHFVWETGFADALRQILQGAQREMPGIAARDLWDYTTDPLVEIAARTLGGGKVWAAMQQSAELASSDDGGATYVARKLREFCGRHRDGVELHAVGHSAGSIFHAHFIPRAAAPGVPAFQSLQFLAPAIRVDLFKRRLSGLIGSQIRKLSMFTMRRDWEEDDNVAAIYRKSLLYLIHYALEPEREAPILGLDISVRRDQDLTDLFGLGQAAGQAEIVWSVSEATTGRSASTSRSHGGFDNDRPTMNSVARRILGSDDIVDFPDEAVERTIDPWSAPISLPAAAQVFATNGHVAGGVRPPVIVSAPAPASPVAAPAAASSGRRLALCVGIDRYPRQPLAGCVADARTWARTLQGLGFESPTLLLDDAATRQGIVSALEALLAGSRPGDVLAFQYAGHGTELPDLDGDETTGRDQAVVPVDFDSGAFLIDDDIYEIFGALPDGVNLTCFFDCCHSGTITRFAVGGPGDIGGPGRRARFLVADPEMKDAHKRFRARRAGRALGAKRPPESMRAVVFSACLDNEVAYENNGHGEFTVRATPLLEQGIHGLTHDEFQRRVTEVFGPTPSQHPTLDCSPGARSGGLLQPIVGVGSGRGRGVSTNGDLAGVARQMQAMADMILAHR